MQTQHHAAEPVPEEKPLMKPLREKGTTMPKRTFYLAVGTVFIILIGAGIGTGYLLSGKGGGSITGASVVSTDGGKAYGSSDTKTFTDTAVGTIEKEGISGEGTHKLVREGGPSQTACLVSSVLDLDEFAGKNVKIYGKTMAAKKCPWLMDVGRIELQ